MNHHWDFLAISNFGVKHHWEISFIIEQLQPGIDFSTKIRREIEVVFTLVLQPRHSKISETAQNKVFLFWVIFIFSYYYFCHTKSSLVQNVNLLNSILRDCSTVFPTLYRVKYCTYIAIQVWTIYTPCIDINTDWTTPYCISYRIGLNLIPRDPTDDGQTKLVFVRPTKDRRSHNH